MNHSNELVWQARHICEYCLIPQAYDRLTFEIDHIIAKVHGGPTIASNLALHKGPNLSGIDPRTGRNTPLFNPRRHSWRRQFRYDGARLVGLAPIGRTTIEVLKINLPQRIRGRLELIEEGVFPPRILTRRLCRR
jgi:hypothetical protein